jgi:hypothetical protein
MRMEAWRMSSRWGWRGAGGVADGDGAVEEEQQIGEERCRKRTRWGAAVRDQKQLGRECQLKRSTWGERMVREIISRERKWRET